MFVVIEVNSNRYYNGRAADWEGNLTAELSKAFEYDTFNAAKDKADKFNAYAKIHGLRFVVGPTDID